MSPPVPADASDSPTTGRDRIAVALPSHAATIERRVPRPTLASTPALLYWRMQRGLIQQQLAEQAGVHRATVARLEAGGQARMDSVGKLAAALGVTPGDLMRQPPEH